ncbi:hypothetical protein [Bauldia litoralis]|uniref:MAE-28990/MAE-18760-like HEPN domain-containing protein n=1 Tax=Bauldia litoralis TaxID=665467 RepID=A0A1G6CF59_9HYPH|nr:hypothetical protein [Bauldia litoralis]SDB31546.1 hypothetical protein SAMN02982931_02417 [Bauldia litoralis]
MPKEPDPKIKIAMAHQVGALFLNFSGFDLALNTAVAAALALSGFQAQVVLSGMQARSKLELLDAFAKKHWTKEAYADTLKLTNEAGRLVAFRNDLAHGVIGTNKDGNFEVVTFRGKHRFDGKATPLSPEIIAPYIDLAESLARVLWRLADKVTEELRQEREQQPREHPAK